MAAQPAELAAMTGHARWLWRQSLRPHARLLIAALVLMALEGSTAGIMSALIRPLFDQAFVPGATGTTAYLALIIAAVFAVRAVAGFGHRVLIARAGETVVADLQRRLLGWLMRLDPLFFQDHPPGSLIERVRGDTAVLRQYLGQIIVAVGRDSVAVLALLAVAISIDWRWTALALAGAPLLVLPLLVLQRLVRRMTRKARAAAAGLATRLDEIFHGQSTIRLSGTEAHEERRFAAEQDVYVRTMVRAEAGAAGIPAMMDLTAGLGFALVISLAGAEIVGGQKTVGEFMAFFTATALLFEPLRRLGAISGALQQLWASLERIRGLFELAPTILSPTVPNPLPVDLASADITFEDVGFSYGRQPVLSGVRLTAKAGQTTAIVGPSGAGKSTLFALLTRLADPDGGRVSLGGTDCREFDLAALRRQISLVAQDTALFDETIRDNILMGAEGVAPARLAEVVAAANLTEFVATLPLGLDTPAGPRGTALSGGQRQRVAIARALLRDAPILLLDEATSALDAGSERAVQEALARLVQGRTVLVIAHRLATVRGAHRIVVIDKGRVAEAGTHDELLAQEGLYAGLCRLQFNE